MATILSGPVTDTSSTGDDCGFISTNFSIYTVSLQSGPSIPGIKVVASNGVDFSVAGNPAYYVQFVTDQLYVDKGSQSLLVQSLSATQETLTAIANIAVPRMQ